MLPSRRHAKRGDRTTAVKKRGPINTEASLKKAQCNLRVHDHNYMGGGELLINPDWFPDIHEGDMVLISPVGDEEGNGIAGSHETDASKSVVLKVSSAIRLPAEISILSVVADIFKLSARMIVEVRKVPKEVARVDQLELSLKDQYISSSEMWRLKLFLSDSWLHIHKQLSMGLVKVRVRDLLRSSENVLGGLVVPDSTVTFRSKSSNLFWLVQVSREMWRHAGGGRLYYELLYELIQRIADTWHEADVNHTLTVVFFARVFVDSSNKPTGDRDEKEDGKQCFDVFKVVLDKVRSSDFSKNSASFLRRIKHEFSLFPSKVRWAAGANDGRSESAKEESREPWNDMNIMSSALEGNTLEALNLTLNNWTDLRMDRGFPYTGTSIVLMTAGTGVMRVDRQLAAITRRRLLDTGMACEIISLLHPRGHEVPIFLFDQRELTINRSTSHDSGFINTLARANKARASSQPKHFEFDSGEGREGSFHMSELLRKESVTKADTEHFAVPDQWLRIRFVGRDYGSYLTHKSRKGVVAVPHWDNAAVGAEIPKTRAEFSNHDTAIFTRKLSGDADVHYPNQEDEDAYESTDGSENYTASWKYEGSLKNSLAAHMSKAYSRSAENSHRVRKQKSTVFGRAMQSSKSAASLPKKNEASPSAMSIQRYLDGDSPLIASAAGSMPIYGFVEGGKQRISSSSLLKDAGNQPSSRPEYGRFDQMRPPIPTGAVDPSVLTNGRGMAISRRHLRAAEIHADHRVHNTSEDPLVLPQEWLRKTLVEPAILPLTTSWTMNENILNSSETLYNYGLAIPNPAMKEREVLSLAKELVCQRMVMDYQVVVELSDETFMYYETSHRGTNEKTTPRSISEGFNSSGRRRCVLAKGEQVHEIIIPNEERKNAVQVIRHVREDDLSFGMQQYYYCLWSEAKNDFLARSATFEYQQEKINWNKLDQLLVDGSDIDVRQVSDDMCRQASFVLIANHRAPGPLFGEERAAGYEKEAQNFLKLFEMITKSNPNNILVFQQDRQLELPWREGYQAPREPLRIRIAMQPFRGADNEWIVFHCDRFFSPDRCFHITLKWVVCDGNVVLDYAQTLQRRAKQLGFIVVPVPVNLFSKTHGAFHNKLTHNITPFQALVLHESLLTTLGFVVNDSRDDWIQYINIHGEVVLSISGSFLAQSSRLQTKMCKMVYTENTLPDFMEESAVRIYRKILRVLGRIKTEEEAIAETVLLCINRAVARS